MILVGKLNVYRLWTVKGDHICLFLNFSKGFGLLSAL